MKIDRIKSIYFLFIGLFYFSAVKSTVPEKPNAPIYIMIHCLHTPGMLILLLKVKFGKSKII